MQINASPKKIKWERSTDNIFSNGKIDVVNWRFRIHQKNINEFIAISENAPFYLSDYDGNNKHKSLEEAEAYCQKQLDAYWMSISEFDFIK